jgi:hypothetical protein
MMVSKEALLKDLEYFGIEHDTDLVQGPMHLASVAAALHAQKERLEYCLLANKCFGCYLRLGNLHIPVSELSIPMASKVVNVYGIVRLIRRLINLDVWLVRCFKVTVVQNCERKKTLPLLYFCDCNNCKREVELLRV